MISTVHNRICCLPLDVVSDSSVTAYNVVSITKVIYPCKHFLVEFKIVLTNCCECFNVAVAIMQLSCVYMNT